MTSGFRQSRHDDVLHADSNSGRYSKPNPKLESAVRFLGIQVDDDALEL
ncbi:hypothetical protein [Methylomonas lenta]|nr:hypothetical protein [Methylomonas lenta]